MKKTLLTLSLIMTSLILLSQTANITLVINGVEEVKGNMSVALYDNEDDFPGREKFVAGKDVPVTSKEFIYTFKDIPNGSYAIAVYHDLDKNGELNSSWVGMPKEPYAFSNNAKGKIGPPDYEEAVFKVEGDTKVVIDLIQ